MRKPILVVDDNDNCRELVYELLSGAGYSVVQATNGKEAIDLLVSEGQVEPALIVLDLEARHVGVGVSGHRTRICSPDRNPRLSAEGC